MALTTYVQAKDQAGALKKIGAWLFGDLYLSAHVPTDSSGNEIAVATIIGAVNETAPASDTASSGLSGRLQRIAQRITSLIALVPTALTGSGNFKVAVQEALPAGTNLVGKVNVSGEKMVMATFTTLTRPANTTPYSINDSISDNATAGSVTALYADVSDTNDDPIIITELLVDTNDTGLGNGVLIRAYLYNSDPTASSGVGAGDNAAFSNKRAGFIGTMSGSFRLFSDGGKARLVPDAGSIIVAAPSTGGKRYWVQYQTLTAFTPSANSTTLDGKLKGFQGRA